MRNNPRLYARLQQLGLSPDEATIFVCLLDGPKTQLEVSRATGIARSNVYRIVDGLVDKSIVHETTTDEGKLLEAASPEGLELLVVQQETAAQARRAGFGEVMQLIGDMHSQSEDFAIKTYSGVAGLKQMLWNELRTEGEICVFSCGSLNDATGQRWAEKFRAECIQRGIRQRALENGHTTTSVHDTFMDHYHQRIIAKDILDIQPEITIHDDTISIYNAWTSDVQLGTEIKNPLLAAFMRQVFEHYWQLAEKDEK